MRLRVQPAASATAPTAVSRPRLFYGWVLVAVGMGLQSLSGLLLFHSYSSYVAVLRSEFGWSKTVFSGGFALQQVESGVIGPMQGWLINRFGPRNTMRAGILLFGSGFLLFSQVQSVATFYLAFVTIAVGNGLCGFLPLNVVIVQWFHRRRATAMGLMATGASIGGLLVPLVAWSLATFGWRWTAFSAGLLVWSVGLPLTGLIRHRPEDHGLLPDGDPPHTGAADAHTGAADRTVATQFLRPAAQPEFTARQALRTRAFWCISLGHAFALLVVSAVSVHLVVYLQESLDYSVRTGATVVALITASSMAGQVGGGFLGDRFSKRFIALVCMLGHMTALLLLAFAAAPWMVLAFAVIHGLCWGTRGPLMQAIRADYFGRTAFATIMGYSSVIVMFGQIGGAMLAGIMADVFNDYRPGFVVIALLAGSGAIFWLLATRPALTPTGASGVSRRS